MTVNVFLSMYASGAYGKNCRPGRDLVRADEKIISDPRWQKEAKRLGIEVEAVTPQDLPPDGTDRMNRFWRNER